MPEDHNTFLSLRDDVMRELIDFMVTSARPSIICDVGSYNGEEALRFAALSPASRVYAFEANRSNIEHYLQPAVTRAGLANVHVENLAVSDTVGTTQFNVLESDRSDPFDWRRMAGSLLRRNDDRPYTTELVTCTTLDFYFADRARDTFALWIDVEGALDRVLAGAHRVLSRTVIFRAEVERLSYWEGQRLVGEVAAIAEELGFHFLADTYVEGGPGQSDALFLNRNWQELIRR
jgi:FkbM family methyltransferase